MSTSARENFMRCHSAMHTLLTAILPCLQNAIDLWHHQAKRAYPPCSAPSACVAKKKPSAKVKSCPECINWAHAIETQVYPTTATGTLQWINANSTLFSKDPLEVMKLFVLRIPANQTFSTLGDFDTASLLMIMSKFKEFHRGDKSTSDQINKVSPKVCRKNLIEKDKKSHLKSKYDMYQIIIHTTPIAFYLVYETKYR